MPSDKHNSIMAIATAGLISSLFNIRHFVQRRAFSPTAVAPMLGSIPFSFSYHVGDDLQYAHYGFGMIDT